MKKNTFCVIFLAILFSSLTIHAEKKQGTGMSTVSIGEMKKEARQKIRKIMSTKKKIEQMVKKAEKEKDLKWKICLDDVMTTIKGIVASSKSAQGRMISLAETGKRGASESQFVLIRGLHDSADRALAEAYSCERNISTVQAKTRVEVEKDDDVSEDTGVSGALGVGFADDIVSSKDKSNLGESDFADGAGSDEVGGPMETPEEGGGEADSIGDDVGITDPEIEDVSPTKK